MKTYSNISKTKTGIFLPILLIGSLWMSKAKAQSTDIDNPTPITSNTLEGMTNPDEKTAFYYSICVKQGTLKVTADLTSEYGGSMVYFHFLNDGFKEIATNDFKGEEHKNRAVKEFKFSKAQKLILKLTFINLTTDSKFTFEGAINTNGDCFTNPISIPPTNNPNKGGPNNTSTVPNNSNNQTPAANQANTPPQNNNKTAIYVEKKIMGLPTDGKTTLKQLTPDDSKIGIYVLEESTQSKFAKDADMYFVQLPNSNDNVVYRLIDNKFSPQFNEKVWQYVQDKPALAEKIKNKEKGFFYPAFTSDKQRLEVWQNIVNEYNKVD